jgi:hypothetical protein
MGVRVHRTVQEAYQVGECDAVAEIMPIAELAGPVAELVGPWLEPIAAAHRTPTPHA